MNIATLSTQKHDFLIVGTGPFGCMFAHLAILRGKKCLVIDKRPHLGGNLYCEHLEGTHVHRYGVHIFHMNSKRVWDFANSIVEFSRCTNLSVVNYKGQLYNLSLNVNTFYQMWRVAMSAGVQAKPDEQRAEAVAKMKAEGIDEPRNSEEQAPVLIGRDIHERLIKGYTEKQWGRKRTELPVLIIKQLSVRLVSDNNYFNDRYQGIPIGGYNKLVDGLLDGVETQVDTDFFVDRGKREGVADRIVYTGKIDEYSDYALGNLEYRTVRFETEALNTASYQGNAVANYTEVEEPYTRITEYRHFEMFGPDVDKNPKTVISCEYSTEWVPGMEPYYPVSDSRNSELYVRYKTLADKEENVTFGGRLAGYKYYDMAPIVDKVLSMFDQDKNNDKFKNSLNHRYRRAERQLFSRILHR